MDVKESLVWAVGWFTGPKRGRKELEDLAVEVLGCRVRWSVELADTVVAVGQDFSNDEGSTSLIGQFGDGAISGGALDLDGGGYNVVDFESLEVAVLLEPILTQVLSATRLRIHVTTQRSWSHLRNRNWREPILALLGRD